MGTVVEDWNSRLWCIGLHDIYLFNPERKSFTRYYYPGQSGIVQLLPATSKRFFAVEFGYGILDFDPGASTPFSEVRAKFKGPAIEYPLTGNSHTLLAGSNRGLCWYDPNTYQTRFITHNISNPTSICDNIITHLFKDKQNNLWIATRNGISLLDPHLQLFHNINLGEKYFPDRPEEFGLVNDFFDDGENYWVSRWYSRGISKFNHDWKLLSHWDILAPDKKNNRFKTVYDIYKESETIFWLCTEGGLVKWDQKKNDFKIFVPEENNTAGTRHHEFRKLLPFGKDQFWIRSWDWGVYVFDRSIEKFTRHYLHSETNEHSLAHNVVKDLIIDKKGKLFVSTIDGLSEYEPVTEIFITHKIAGNESSGGMKNYLGKMEVDRQNNIWICFVTGLLQYNSVTRSFTQYNTVNGLVNNNCLKICKDKNDNLWITTQNGISFYNFKTNSFTNYYSEDGLPTNFFEGALTNTSNGKIAVGYLGGLVLIHPDSLPFNHTAPPVRFNSLKVMDRNLYYTRNDNGEKEIRLRYNQKIVSVSFSVLNFTNPSRNKYYYQLSGFDKDWRQSEDGNVTYTNLNPGTYTLKVRGANNSGVMNEEGDVLHIIISPAFWQTLWFKILVFLIAGGIIFYLVRRRISSIRHQAELKQKMAEAEMMALRAQMNPHFIFNCLSSIDNLIQTHQPDKATTYLARFAKLIRSVLDSSKNNIVSFQKDFESLQLYLQMEQFRCNNKFTYELNAGENLLQGDYQVPPLIIQPFIENAIHHGLLNKPGSDRNLKINITADPHYIKYIIADNGVGRTRAAEIKKLNKPEHVSYGIRISADRIHLYNKNGETDDIIIQDLEDNGKPAGTKVEVKIKIHDTH